MTKESIWRHFQGEAEDYDGLIPRLIPHYHEQNEILLNLIPFDTDANLSVLDLGAGTGILSELILKSFPQSRVTAFDLSERMLELVSRKLSGFKDRLEIKLGDFSTDNLGSDYDLIVSGLAIHHLDDDHKTALFRRLFESLNMGGTLLIRDCVKGATPSLTEQYEKLWRAFMQANGEDDAKWFARYLEEDTPSSVNAQLGWLSEAGFVNIGCHWRYLNFAIFGGETPSS